MRRPADRRCPAVPSGRRGRTGHAARTGQRDSGGRRAASTAPPVVGARPSRFPGVTVLSQQSTSSGRWLSIWERAETNSASATGRGAEDGDTVAVLERQPDAEMALDRGAHRVAGHHPQQLAAGGLVRRRVPGCRRTRPPASRSATRPVDHVPGVRQRGADAVQERRVATSPRLACSSRSAGTVATSCCPSSVTVRLPSHPHMKMITIAIPTMSQQVRRDERGRHQ